MSYPSQQDVLCKLYDRLSGDANLVILTGGRIKNHLPQDDPMPYLRFHISNFEQWSTQTTDGYNCTVTIDAWVNDRGDKNVMTIIERVIDILDGVPLNTDAKNVCLYMQNTNYFIEPDGVSHHGTVDFNLSIMQ